MKRNNTQLTDNEPLLILEDENERTEGKEGYFV